MSTLRDRLADLAEDAPPAPAAPDLWGRGRRYARRRRAATVGAVVALVLLATLSAAGIAGRPLHPVQPAAPEGRPVLPDRIFAPSPRLPVADGPTGPLVAVLPAEHFDWLGHGAPGLVGVSAVDQSYAFLDLPGFLGEDGLGETWSLSGDGRRLAYWYGEPTDGTGTVVADGIAVVDTTSGDVRRHAFGAPLGVAPQRVGWAGDTLLFAEDDYTELRPDGSSSTVVAAWSWAPEDDGPRRVEDPHLLLTDPSGPAGTDGFLAAGPHRRWYAVRTASDLAGPPVARLDTGETRPALVTLSPDGQTLAWVQPDGSDAGPLTTAPVGDDQPVSRRDVALGRFPRLLGWLDDDRVAVVTTQDGRRVLLAADVTTGAVERLTTFDQTYSSGEQLAVGLLDAPVVGAVAPPQPHDPRLVAAAVGGGVLALLVLGLAVRRRRGRR